MTYIPDPAGRGRPQPRGGERLARLATEAAGASSPGAALRRVRALRRELDDFEREQVARALADGASFAAVGRDLGLSRQAVHRRFRGVAVAGPDEPPLLLTAAARLAFRHAREEAVALRTDLGGEHLLLGAMRAAALPPLADAGVTLDKVRTEVSASVPGTGLFERRGAELDLRPLLAEPAREAVRLGSRRIEPAHLVLGVLREPDSPAVRTLRAIGADPEAIRSGLERL